MDTSHPPMWWLCCVGFDVRSKRICLPLLIDFSKRNWLHGKHFNTFVNHANGTRKPFGKSCLSRSVCRPQCKRADVRRISNVVLVCLYWQCELLKGERAYKFITMCTFDRIFKGGRNNKQTNKQNKGYSLFTSTLKTTLYTHINKQHSTQTRVI